MKWLATVSCVWLGGVYMLLQVLRLPPTVQTCTPGWLENWDARRCECEWFCCLSQSCDRLAACPEVYSIPQPRPLSAGTGSGPQCPCTHKQYRRVMDVCRKSNTALRWHEISVTLYFYKTVWQVVAFVVDDSKISRGWFQFTQGVTTQNMR